MLTVEMLEKMPYHKIFARGEIADSAEGLNMTTSGEMLRWVAVRGGIADWAIYCHFSDKNWDWIRDSGDKVTMENHIRKLVPCTDEAFKRYRY